MSRPRGVIRTAIFNVYASAGAHLTWRDAAEAACVGYDAARRTCHDMARAGELVRVGVVNGMAAFELPASQASAGDACRALQSALCAWPPTTTT